MPANTEKQKRFFFAVKRAKHEPGYGDASLHKVADSMTDKDIDDFTKLKAEFKVKKAVLSVLKDAHQSNKQTLDEGDNDVIVKEFNVEGKFEEYVERFMGQNLKEKEMEAVNTFQEVKPTKIQRNQIRYETTDEFKNSTTTVIKKLKEGGQFVFVAFTKYSKAEKPGDQQQGAGAGGLGGLGGGFGGSPMMETDQPTSGDTGIPSNPDFAGGMPPYENIFKNRFGIKNETHTYLNWPSSINEQLPADPLTPIGATPPAQPMGGPAAPGAGPLTTTAPMTGTPKSSEQKKKEMGIDDILVKKSTNYTDDIKGGAILAEFLKKLDL